MKSFMRCRHDACVELIDQAKDGKAAAVAAAILQKTRQFETILKVCRLLSSTNTNNVHHATYPQSKLNFRFLAGGEFTANFSRYHQGCT